jgi:hypothetical protein
VESDASELLSEQAWAKTIRVERKLLARAIVFLGDECVLRIFRGQTRLSPVMLPVIGSVPFIRQPRTIIAKEKSIVTVQQSAWSESVIVRLVSRYACGSVPVYVSDWALKIAHDEQVFALLTTFRDMKAVARLAARAVV